MVYSLQSRVWSAPIVTEIKPFDIFYPAEDYHQNYYQNNPTQPYCNVVITPKLFKIRKEFDHLIRPRK
jgi:peptide-methionine (S)-S-oxide reductase